MGKTLLGKVVALALAGAMMVSAVPAFADEYIVEDTETAEEEILTDSAQDAEEQGGDLYDGVLIEDMDVAEHKNAYDEGNLWYNTRYGTFSGGTGYAMYTHEYPSEIGGWDEIPTPADGSKTFLGYSLTEGGEIVELPFQFEEPGTILWAVWGSNVEYTITLDANGGKFLDAATSKNFKYKDGTVLNMAYELEEGELPVAVDGPGDFLGYSATQGGSVLTSYKVTGNATLYAVWEDYADCEHVWVRDEASSVPASCTEAGKDVYVCSKCNAFEERPVQATGHSFGEWTITKDASCTEPGVKTHTCSGCGKSETETIPVAEHKWDNGVITKKPTTTSEGVKTYTCTVCSETKTESIAKISDSGSKKPTTPTEKITIGKKPASVKAKATKKNKASVSWKKFKKTKKTKATWKKIKKIEIQYSTDKAFSAVNTKHVLVGKSKTKYTIKGLQKNTTYYVRVRYTDGAGGYSNWSSAKKVKTKKK